MYIIYIGKKIQAVVAIVTNRIIGRNSLRQHLLLLLCFQNDIALCVCIFVRVCVKPGTGPISCINNVLFGEIIVSLDRVAV